MNEEMTVYENRGGEVWERHPDGRRELFAEDIIRKLTTQERELTAVTEQLKAAQDGWHDEITKGLSELRRAESLYTKAQERAERAEEQRDEYKAALQSADNHNHEIGTKLEIVTEQRDRLAEALQSVKCELGVPQPEYPSPVANAYWIADKALQSLNQPQPTKPEPR